MAKIINLGAREILDSRGNPTIEVKLILDRQITTRVAIPAGTSTGEHEAVARHDGIDKVNGEIASKFIGHDFDQASLDQELIALDGTPDKSRLGANATLGVSLAFAQAWAKSQNKELFETLPGPFKLPIPMFNILNGGRHATSSTDIQEFMVVPIGAQSFAEALAWGKVIWQKLKETLGATGLDIKLGDEGGFAPQLVSNTEALDLIIEAIKQAGFEPGRQVVLALDIAASELFVGNKYMFKKDNRSFASAELITWYEELVVKYPLILIEDGLSEDDWVGWQDLTVRLGGKINVAGDDLFTTNLARLQMGIDKKVANAIIIKPNQIGTLTETLAVIKLAQSANYKIIVSHRSGETLDTTIADLAVGVGADFIKAGAPSRPERLAKYDHLVEIEKKLGK